jgi:signal transduction histidine kinase
VIDAATSLINNQAFIPYGNGFQGVPSILWLHAISNALIFLSCYSLSLALLYLVRKRPGTRFYRLIVLFSILIFIGGTIHLLSIWTIWQPDYRLDAMMKILTALVLSVTAVMLWPMIFRAISKPSRTTAQLHSTIDQLEHEVAERRRAEEALQKSKEQLRLLAAYQEQVKEDERKRIAREIHDELGQNLMALRIDVSILQARTSDSHPILNERVRSALTHIDASIKAVRNIINNLRPSVLDLGLPAAIEWQVNEFERRTGIACELAIEGDQVDANLDDHRATALFRILQESLTNVARHAQASLVQIKLHRNGAKFCMKIADNGVGLFPGCRRKPNSFGLLGIGERITALAGEFTVDSIPGNGTVLEISIPVEEAVSDAAASSTHYVA